MIKLVTEAQAARAPSERFSEWFGQRYTIGVLVGSIVAYGIFLWAWQRFAARALPFCHTSGRRQPLRRGHLPAAPLRSFAAAARGGVLFKGGAALETLGSVRSFAFDKTGTLTTGRAEVVDIVAIGMSEDDFIARLSGLEHHSEHPVADAIRRSWKARGMMPVKTDGVQAITSEGIDRNGRRHAILGRKPSHGRSHGS